jgi:tripartite-type tricarboxylate transporter receptor subunit TctC
MSLRNAVSATVLAVLLVGLGTPGARAQSPACAALPDTARLPAGPIRLVVGFAAGGGIDTFARYVGQRITELTGRAVIVENKAGAGGTIAAADVVRSEPDGRTLLVGENGVISTGRVVYPGLSFDPVEDLVPVALGALQAVVLLTPAATGPANLQALIDMARTESGRVTYASAGAGNPTHLFAVDLAARIGATMTHVPYRGGSQMMQAILSKDVDIGFFSLATALPQIRSGTARALAVGEEEGHPALPEVPPASRTVPGFVFAFWYGFHAPKATPAPLVDALNAVLCHALSSPEARSWLDGQGLTGRTGTPAAYRAFIARESERWESVARKAAAAK